MSFIPVTNFVNVSVSSPPPGLDEYAVNNLAIFTKEEPVVADIGPGAAAAAYTTSLTGSNNDLVFTAKSTGAPGNGISIIYNDPGADNVLGIIVTGLEIQVDLATNSGGAITSTAADIKAAIDGDTDASALVSVANKTGDTGAGVVTAMSAEFLVGGSSGLYGLYKSPSDVATDWGSGSEVYSQAVAIFSQNPNILDGNGVLVIVPMASDDLLADVIESTITQIFFGGALWAGYDPADDEILAAGAVCETLRVKLFASSYLTSTLTTTTGLFWKVQDRTLNHTRCLLYIVGGTLLAARLMAAAYAGRALSVNFSSSQTTTNMHGKTLIGIGADTGITQTILGTCQTVGVDVYPSVGGGAQYLGKVFTSGENEWFDNVYNLDWLVFALEVAGFNALTTTSTKIPQTEPGMAVLRGAYLAVLEQSVNNGYVAPGVWNSPELFGNPEDLRRNVLDTGYYLYSQPVNLQPQADREAREAPPIRIAIKLAGAINSSSVIVSVNQ